jgi:hypothetical protein
MASWLMVFLFVLQVFVFGYQPLAISHQPFLRISNLNKLLFCSVKQPGADIPFSCIGQ